MSSWFEASESGDPINMAILKRLDAQKRDKEEMEERIEELIEEEMALNSKMYELAYEKESLKKLIARKNIAISNLQKSLLVANSDKLE